MAGCLLQKLVFIFVGLGVGAVNAKTYDPMVAFVCNKGAMHMDPDKGWYRDSRTNCFESKADILTYCQMIYPSLDIRNIVETSDHMTIKGWCPLGESECSLPDTFKVRPYRCLAGEFESDVLVVPRDCEFDHVHTKDKCRDFSYWSDVASQRCTDDHQMNMQMHAMLLPCGTDMFAGVEFVCCPQGVSESSISPSLSLPEPQIEVKVSKSAGSGASAAGDDVVNRYMDLETDAGEYVDEHDAFELAKKHLLTVNHDQITGLMKSWEDARDHVTKLRESDANEAEKMNAEITERFQKEYFALQAEGDKKALQLDAVHQQHVQANLNYKKRHAMQNLMQELQAKFYSTATINELLQRYISVEEKDAHHCMAHFIKIRARDPQAAQDMLPTTIEHLTLISTRINQSIDLLDIIKDKNVVAKMKESIRSWQSRSYVSLEKTVTQFKSLVTTDPQTKPSLPAGMTPTSDDQDDSAVYSSANMYKIYAEKLSKTDFVKKPNQYASSLQEEQTPEDEHAPRAADMKKSEMNAEVQGVAHFKGSQSTMAPGAVVAVALGIIAAMMVVVFAILIVKKKSRRSRRANTYLEVKADDVTPEDRHIAAMQNGYENPTYKLLEHKKV